MPEAACCSMTSPGGADMGSRIRLGPRRALHAHTDFIERHNAAIAIPERLSWREPKPVAWPMQWLTSTQRRKLAGMVRSARSVDWQSVQSPKSPDWEVCQGACSIPSILAYACSCTRGVSVTVHWKNLRTCCILRRGVVRAAGSVCLCC